MIRSIFRLCNAFGQKINEDDVSAYSAQAAFFIILSFFPFIMFLLTLLNYLPFSQNELLAIVKDFFPEQISNVLTGIINELTNSASGTLLSVTVVIAIWTASKGFLSIFRGLNSVYHIQETRNYIILRIRAVVDTIIFAGMLILLLALFVFGNQISLWLGEHFPIVNDLALLIISVRTIVGFCILILFFLALFCFVPNRKTNLFHELPGAIISAAGWIGFSYLYSFYIDNMSNMTAIYGSLTAIVLCMLWLYACMNITFFGAEINSVLANPVVRSAIRGFFRRKSGKKACTGSDTLSKASLPDKAETSEESEKNKLDSSI